MRHIAGIIHKASEPDNYFDSTYNQRKKNALAAALLWGAYHFPRPGNMTDQAQYFVSEVGKNLDLYVADYEDKGVSLDSLKTFLREVKPPRRTKTRGPRAKAKKTQAKARGALRKRTNRNWCPHHPACWRRWPSVCSLSGGKADIAICTAKCPLYPKRIGPRRHSAFAKSRGLKLPPSAYDPSGHAGSDDHRDSARPSGHASSVPPLHVCQIIDAKPQSASGNPY